jgi:hypothetical protein
MYIKSILFSLLFITSLYSTDVILQNEESLQRKGSILSDNTQIHGGDIEMNQPSVMNTCNNTCLATFWYVARDYFGTLGALTGMVRTGALGYDYIPLALGLSIVSSGFLTLEHLAKRMVTKHENIIMNAQGKTIMPNTIPQDMTPINLADVYTENSLNTTSDFSQITENGKSNIITDRKIDFVDEIVKNATDDTGYTNDWIAWHNSCSTSLWYITRDYAGTLGSLADIATTSVLALEYRQIALMLSTVASGLFMLEYYAKRTATERAKRVMNDRG